MPPLVLAFLLAQSAITKRYHKTASQNAITKRPHQSLRFLQRVSDNLFTIVVQLA